MDKNTNAARLEKMRRNLDALEEKARAILEKPELSKLDRLALLTFVNVAFHASGKIEGVFSIDSAVNCRFCACMRTAAKADPTIICGLCYAAADSWKEAARRRHELNARILSTVLFTEEELMTLSIPGTLCRFNEDGDTVNDIMGRNYLRIGKTHPWCHFGYWFKNRPAVEKALYAEGYKTREDLPENVRFIQSSIRIGFEARPAWFADNTFTVYPDTESTENAVAAGAHECNGRKCKDCGYHCYMGPRTENPGNVAEILRASAAKRAAISAAVRAKKGA